MITTHVEAKIELPPIGKRVRVEPWKKKIWLDKYTFINFIPEQEYYGKVIRVLTYSGTILVWDIEEFEKYHFPIETISYWVEEIFDPIDNRFEILDL
jgi:hypothetical protein